MGQSLSLYSSRTCVPTAQKSRSFTLCNKETCLQKCQGNLTIFCNLVFLIFNLHFHFLKATEEESVEDENDQEDDSRKRAASSEPEENDNGEPEAKKTATENNGVEADTAAGRPKRATRKT